MEDQHTPTDGEAELRLAALEAELRDKYTQKQRDEMAKAGLAMPDGAYPIKDAEDLDNAISTVGLGNAPDSAIRKHIIARAQALGLSSKIPDSWNADGSKKQTNAAAGRRKERRRAVPLGREYRRFGFDRVEIREQADTDEIVITGQPIVYNQPYEVYDGRGQTGYFQERMHPGCATPVLERGVDCRLLINHEGLPLARTTAGTLRLWDTNEALNFEARLDARQQLANDLAIAIERKDLTQMSVGMIVGRDEWGESESGETRDVYGLDDLLDVSGVTYPASPTTAIEIAQRAALQVPIESFARLRQLEVELRSGRISADELAEGLAIFQGHEERAGKTLSGANSGKVVSAIEALHALYEAGGGNPADLIDDGESESNETALAQDGTREDGEPITTKASTLRLQLEARARKRKRQKIAA
jgi:hypothetical protein